jgi:hypothetical protein
MLKYSWNLSTKRKNKTGKVTVSKYTEFIYLFIYLHLERNYKFVAYSIKDSYHGLPLIIDLDIVCDTGLLCIRCMI